MLGACAASLQHGGDVLQRLAGLGDEIVRLKLLSGVPADLAADEQQVAARQYAVGITPGLGPVGRLNFCQDGVSKGVCR